MDIDMPPRPRTMSRDPAPAASGIVERFAGLWSALAWSMVRPYLPRHLLPDRLAGGSLLRRHARRLLAGLLDPYLTVTPAEYGGGEGMRRGAAYERAAAYLGARCAREARTLRAESARDGGFVLRVDDGEEVADEFRGATVWWHAVPAPHHRHGGPRCDAPGEDAGRTYRLVFHQRHRDLVVNSYLPHVCREGRAIMEANRRRKLFTNAGERYGKSSWKHVAFKHPSTFDTLAMDPAKKREIMDDLDAFRKGKEYYRRIGKAWKRGYLLYGPPGTGKSSMIAAMANYLDYDIYDIELTSVSTNTELRRMFIDTKGKSIIVIEDIDCSLDLTGKRRGRQQPLPGPADDDADAPPPEPTSMGRGLWSACGGERVIVFTTNHAERLDPALIRRGRMDKHIEMSYCCFESFRFLARNYLAVDAHPPEVDITPADVAELLTPKRAGDDEGSCLVGLVEALREAAAAAAKNATSNNIQEDGEVVEDE
ncbi:hypothetical protein C2845_PM04G05070 [Panicum miliaceum]|uniref:AAA+ ATPase domain-containing protein n=1 Tax=Panicum miliaceum TaxID=4540 RepID=A0A3L6QRF5_PANMI|nr:hypothetical protein C2845_PM04G05070 [Panicum miliaceum]